ncbi:hypothetical protein [Streptomyces sp. NPDC056144]|uniref:hypothetical protein n=1 Tax=unclassified Streptomyces TaxID=2593676 RepID=UPI0035D757FE
MSKLAQRRITAATDITRTGLEDLLREVRTGLDAADRRHVLDLLYTAEGGGTGLLPLLSDIVTTVSLYVGEGHPNHEAATEALDEAAAYIADSAGHRVTTARNLLTRPAKRDWPTPEQAYAKAPSTISEIGWTARTAAERPFGTEASREFWLRKAALLDRIALDDETAHVTTDAAKLADQAARRLMNVDEAPVICDPRAYVRQQYAAWTTNR